MQDDGLTGNGGVDLDPVAKTMSLNVTPINDAPAGTSKTIQGFEDTTYTFNNGDFGFTDPQDAIPPSSVAANHLLAVRITSLATNGTLTFNNGTSDVPVTLGQTILASDVDLSKFKFVPNPNANGTPYATFTFQVKDDGGTAFGGVDLEAPANAHTITLNIGSVNDAPQGALNNPSTSVNTLEDTTYTFAAGDFGFQDPNDNPANTLQSVVIVSIPSAGTFTAGGNFILPGTEVSLATITGNGLRFTPAGNANGNNYASFTFRVRDNGGTANGGSIWTPTARTMAINVTPVNDAPVGTTKTVTTPEDTSYTFGPTDFASASLNVFDPNDTSPPSSLGPNQLQDVLITSLPVNGTLNYNGAPLAAGQLPKMVTVADLTGNLLIFVPAANANGTTYAQFGFKVQDTGGTANNGLDTDPTAKTITVNVTAVPDNPLGADKTIGVSEDSFYNFTAGDFGFSDPSDASPPSRGGAQHVQPSEDHDAPGLGHADRRRQRRERGRLHHAGQPPEPAVHAGSQRQRHAVRHVHLPGRGHGGDEQPVGPAEYDHVQRDQHQRRAARHDRPADDQRGQHPHAVADDVRLQRSQ